jgi:hypothetical protein
MYPNIEFLEEQDKQNKITAKRYQAVKGYMKNGKRIRAYLRRNKN